MDDHEILEHIKQSAWDDLEYFSNKNKEGRERWVVSKFLSVIDVPHEESELQSLEQSSKIDVQFRDANFQVKELPDPDLRRGKIYKDKYNSVKKAKTLEEITLKAEVRDTPPIANMFELILKNAEELACSKLYEKSKSELDLLIYVTRTRASLIQQYELNEQVFSSMGWRSISCVNNKQAVVLYTAAAAPRFIKEKLQMLMSNNG